MGSGQPRKRTAAVEDVVELAMRVDDETMGRELWQQLSSVGHQLLVSTVIH